MEPLFSGLSLEEAEAFHLVLVASDIPHTTARAPMGFDLLVPPEHEANALRQILAFQSENQPWLEKKQEKPLAVQNASGVWAALVLLGFYLAFGPLEENSLLFHEKGALAEAICHGQAWRALTALFLHVDVTHLAGNMAGMAIFGTAVAQTTGTGVGLALILASGFLGNMANAGFYQTHHLSAGASTAVFGAIGLLAGFRLLPRGPSRDRARPWLILGAGLALLALLGNGPRSDLLAHVFGYGSGIALGLVYRRLRATPAAPRFQFLWLYAAIAAIAGAWALSGF